MEHFVTLFDCHFIPHGLSLYASLTRHVENGCLWVIALDEETEAVLKACSHEALRVIPLREMETAELLRVKPTRSRVEYFWTLSAFTFQAVFEREPAAPRATYIDADCFFFSSPERIFRELEQAKAHALITEHAYDPRYDQSSDSGKYCVQFVTVSHSPEGLRIMRWWQERCLEWCYNRVEEGKFGDQKYLEQWPVLFGPAVHVLEERHAALAPWNAQKFTQDGLGGNPVFFHFHGLRIVSRSTIQLSTFYEMAAAVMRWYKLYYRELCRQMRVLKSQGFRPHYLPAKPVRSSRFGKYFLREMFIRRTEHWAVKLPICGCTIII